MMEQNLCLLCKGTGYEIVEGEYGAPCAACQARGMTAIKTEADENLKQFYNNVRSHCEQVRDHLIKGRPPMKMNSGAHSLVIDACTTLAEFVQAAYGDKNLALEDVEFLKCKFGSWQPGDR